MAINSYGTVVVGTTSSGCFDLDGQWLVRVARDDELDGTTHEKWQAKRGSRFMLAPLDAGSREKLRDRGSEGR